jgi:hypothetical protein
VSEREVILGRRRRRRRRRRRMKAKEARKEGVSS